MGKNNHFFAGQSCSKLQTPKDVFSKDCHRQRDCAKWITCQWRYWNYFSFSKVFLLLFRIWSGRVRHPADVHQSWIPGCWSILDHSEGPVCRREKRSTFSHWGHRLLSWIRCAQFPWEALWRSPRPWNSWIPTLILLPRGLKLPRRQGPCPFFNHNVEPQEAKTWGRQVHRWEQRDRLHDQEWAIPLHNFGLWPPSGYSSGHFSY